MLEKTLKKWGSEELIVNTNYCGKRMILEKNSCCSLHAHKIKDETFFISEGKMLLEINEDDISRYYVLNKDSFFRIKPNTYHRFYGIERTIFFEFSTHDESSDSYRKEESQTSVSQELIFNLINIATII